MRCAKCVVQVLQRKKMTFAIELKLIDIALGGLHSSGFKQHHHLLGTQLNVEVNSFARAPQSGLAVVVLMKPNHPISIPETQRKAILFGVKGCIGILIAIGWPTPSLGRRQWFKAFVLHHPCRDSEMFHCVFATAILGYNYRGRRGFEAYSDVTNRGVEQRYFSYINRSRRLRRYELIFAGCVLLARQLLPLPN